MSPNRFGLFAQPEHLRLGEEWRRTRHRWHPCWSARRIYRYSPRPARTDRTRSPCPNPQSRPCQNGLSETNALCQAKTPSLPGSSSEVEQKPEVKYEWLSMTPDAAWFQECVPRLLPNPLLSQSIWSHRFGQTGLFSAPRLTISYRTPWMST